MGLDYRIRCCPDGLMTDRRRDVSVLDCTIRDGGICNDWHFDTDLVRDTVTGLAAAGVEVMEIGYRNQPGRDAPDVGKWRFCAEDDLREVATASRMKLAVMMDQGRSSLDDLLPAEQSLVDVVRVATYARDIDDAIALSHGALDKGYEVAVNVMAVSTCTPQEVDHFLGRLRDSRVGTVNVVDSYGAMYPHHIRYLIRKYKNWLRKDQKVGVHFHNNQQTAFANTIAAIDEGADVVDASIHGMGRGAGNCPLELLLLYLDAPRYDVHPVLDLVGRYAELKEELRWGYQVPYGITGWLNLHPHAAIERMKTEHANACLDFFDTLTRNRDLPRHHEVVLDLPARRVG